MPVREALLLLSHEGMIDARPNRGFRVARMGKRDIEDIYWTHAALAGRLTARASERLSDASLLELEENNRSLAAALESGDMDKVESLNWQFHRVINLAADSQRVLALLKSTAHQIPKHFYTMLGSWGRLSMHDHTELLEALRQRDATRAEKLAVDHVAAAGRLMVDYLLSQGSWNMHHDQEIEESKSPNKHGPQEARMNLNDRLARLPEVPTFTLTSTMLTDGDNMPPISMSGIFGVPGGGDISPELAWTGAPPETKSYVVTLYDPDAPTGSGFWHWAVVDIPASTTELVAGAGHESGENLPAGAFQLSNDAGLKRFLGAAPPAGHGPHRYVFVVHAVDVESLGVPPDATPAFLGFNIFSHILARAVLTVTAEQ